MLNHDYQSVSSRFKIKLLYLYIVARWELLESKYLEVFTGYDGGSVGDEGALWEHEYLNLLVDLFSYPPFW